MNKIGSFLKRIRTSCKFSMRDMTTLDGFTSCSTPCVVEKDTEDRDQVLRNVAQYAMVTQTDLTIRISKRGAISIKVTPPKNKK